MTALAVAPTEPVTLPIAPAAVVIACHTEQRFDALARAIASARRQIPSPQQVIVAVDHNPALCARLARVDGITVVDHQGEPGASGARNAGAERAEAEFLVFLDDDTQAHPGWLAELLRPFADPAVAGSGGAARPAWLTRRPSWFPDEFGWTIGVSHTGLPTRAARVRNVWSENMAVRRSAFTATGGFRQGFGKVGDVSRPEDTDFCIRVGTSPAGGHWVYLPDAVVDHEVPGTRATLRFFLRRCFWEGAGKAEMSSHLGDDRDLADERRYLTHTLPIGVLRHLATGHPLRGLAIIAGVAAAGLGGAHGTLRHRALTAHR